MPRPKSNRSPVLPWAWYGATCYSEHVDKAVFPRHAMYLRIYTYGYVNRYRRYSDGRVRLRSSNAHQNKYLAEPCKLVCNRSDRDSLWLYDNLGASSVTVIPTEYAAYHNGGNARVFAMYHGIPRKGYRQPEYLSVAWYDEVKSTWNAICTLDGGPVCCPDKYLHSSVQQ